MASPNPNHFKSAQRMPYLLLSLALHLLLVLSLSPGHDEEHTVQLFKGVIELGESGDGHADVPHVHTPKQRRPRPEPEPEELADTLATKDDSAADESSGEPIDVTTPDGSGATGGTATALGEAELYLLGVLKRIQKARSYPRESLLREEEGDVTVSLTIGRDGSIAALELAKPCPFESLNRSALRSVRAAGPFAPLPDLWNRSIRVRIPLHYELNRR